MKERQFEKEVTVKAKNKKKIKKSLLKEEQFDIIEAKNMK